MHAFQGGFSFDNFLKILFVFYCIKIMQTQLKSASFWKFVQIETRRRGKGRPHDLRIQRHGLQNVLTTVLTSISSCEPSRGPSSLPSGSGQQLDCGGRRPRRRSGGQPEVKGEARRPLPLQAPGQARAKGLLIRRPRQKVDGAMP